MSEAKFTLGPWKLAIGTIPNLDGSDVLTVYGPNVKVGDIAEVIAVIVDESHCENKDKANACLIAAAPDMYTVLKELSESACYWSEYDVPIGIVDRINEALAKAEGKLIYE